MDWFTILIVLLFVVFPLIQQMLEARKRSNTPPPEEMEGYSEGYPDGEVRREDEPMGLPEGWRWESDVDHTDAPQEAWDTPRPERRPSAPEPVAAPRMPEHAPRSRGEAPKSRMPEHIPRTQTDPSQSRMPQHIPRTQTDPSQSRMPQHIPRTQTDPSQSRMPEHIPRTQAPAAPSRRMPEHIPRPRAEAPPPQRRPAPDRRQAETEPAPMVVSLESLRPIWEERRERRARPAAAKQAPVAQPQPGIPQMLRDRDDLRRAVLLSAVLGKPRALRPYPDPMLPDAGD